MNGKRYVKCGDVGRAAFCPTALKMRAQGAEINAQSEKRMAQGEVNHQAFNKHIMEDQDKRCFIATACFGAHDDTTQFFRDYRDDVLKGTVSGRLFVRVYYAVSPYVVTCINRAPSSFGFSGAASTKNLIRKVLVLLRRKLEK